MDEDGDGLSVWWILFSQFIGKFAKTFAPMFGVVLCEHKYLVPTLRVGVSLNQGFHLEIEWHAHRNPNCF